MIQFKKIPPSKAVLLFLLFLTTNAYGFLRNNDVEHRETRKSQDRFSMDLQQPRTMSIRKIDTDRVINEKDRNTERVYDRRSFRTGTIDRVKNLESRERSTEHRDRNADIRDLNNNRQRLTRNFQDRLQNTRENRRTFEDTTRTQRFRENRRSDERAVINRNIQYNERRSLDTTEKEIDRRVERSLDSRDRRNVNIRDTKQISKARTNTEASLINDQRNIRAGVATERREIRNRQRELPQRQMNNRDSEDRLPTRQSERFAASRQPLETRRTIRSVDIRDERYSEERGEQRRLSADRLERTNTREISLERGTVENHGRRIHETRTTDLTRLSRENLVRTNSNDRRLENRDRRTSDIRNENQRRSSTNLERTSFPERRSVENHERRNLNQNRLPSDLRRNQNLNRLNPLERRSAESDRRISENQERERLINNRRIRSVSEERDNFSRYTSRVRDSLKTRTSRDDRTRTVQEQTRREPQEMSQRSMRIRELIPESAERREHVTIARKTTDRSLRTDSRSDRRDSRVTETREQSRSDSTRYIRENIRSTRDVRQDNRQDTTRIAREVRSDNTRRQNVRDSDRYDPLTADSRRYFERVVSQRTTRDAKMPKLSLERNLDNNYTWASTIKVLLAAFLIGQIFVNSSKVNKARFHNIIAMATSIKEKIH